MALNHEFSVAPHYDPNQGSFSGSSNYQGGSNTRLMPPPTTISARTRPPHFDSRIFDSRSCGDLYSINESQCVPRISPKERPSPINSSYFSVQPKRQSPILASRGTGTLSDDFQEVTYQNMQSFMQDVARHSSIVDDNNSTTRWCWGIMAQGPHSSTSSYVRSVSNDGTSQDIPQAYSHLSQTSKEPFMEAIPPNLPASSSHFRYQRFSKLRPARKTAEQRKKSHILQERERRASMKKSFDELIALIPNLGQRDVAKSTILAKAADWLGSLENQIKLLRDHLDSIESLHTHMNFA
ncbi:hypothetical protein QQS21_007866 [Conoideocrella luteorostrata]|uniref:BHLH domain-containing protein n=1 Tax=Conoideocrella luteorostrata TaxID=1105319 RepID=A0AAJ0CMP8_9HYPO|nr:hypothetical protein QQS21_007866 [Conoideocrella luteorostrata]